MSPKVFDAGGASAITNGPAECSYHPADVNEIVAQRDAALAWASAAEAQRDAVVEALEALMAWIGPPPADRHSFDSIREDAWKKAKAALAQAGKR